MSMPNPVKMLTLALPFLLMAAGSASAQEELPDLQGRWILVKERCVPPQQTGRMRGGLTGVPVRMDITMEGNQVTIERRNELSRGARNETTEVFAIDGEPWPQEVDEGEMTITAEWKNGTIFITRTITTTRGERQMQTNQTEMWQYVEQDGQVGMAINIQPPERAMPEGAAGARPGATPPGGDGRRGGRMGGRGGRGGGGSALQNIILVFDLRRR